MGTIKSLGRLDIPLPHGPDTFQFGELEDLKAALAETGFVDVDAYPAPLVLRLVQPTAFMDAVLEGTVRAKALLLGQDEATLLAIRKAVDEAVVNLFRREDGFQVPMPSIVGSGVKPGG